MDTIQNRAGQFWIKIKYILIFVSFFKFISKKKLSVCQVSTIFSRPFIYFYYLNNHVKNNYYHFLFPRLIKIYLFIFIIVCLNIFYELALSGALTHILFLPGHLPIYSLKKKINI